MNVHLIFRVKSAVLVGMTLMPLAVKCFKQKHSNTVYVLFQLVDVRETDAGMLGIGA